MAARNGETDATIESPSKRLNLLKHGGRKAQSGDFEIFVFYMISVFCSWFCKNYRNHTNHPKGISNRFFTIFANDLSSLFLINICL